MIFVYAMRYLRRVPRDWETVKNCFPWNSSSKPDQTGSDWKGVKQSEMFINSVYSRLGNNNYCHIHLLQQLPELSMETEALWPVKKLQPEREPLTFGGESIYTMSYPAYQPQTISEAKPAIIIAKDNLTIPAAGDIVINPKTTVQVSFKVEAYLVCACVQSNFICINEALWDRQCTNVKMYSTIVVMSQNMSKTNKVDSD